MCKSCNCYSVIDGKTTTTTTTQIKVNKILFIVTPSQQNNNHASTSPSAGCEEDGGTSGRRAAAAGERVRQEKSSCPSACLARWRRQVNVKDNFKVQRHKYNHPLLACSWRCRAAECVHLRFWQQRPLRRRKGVFRSFAERQAPAFCCFVCPSDSLFRVHDARRRHRPALFNQDDCCWPQTHADVV